MFIGIENTVNELSTVYVALEAAERAVKSGDLNRTGYALDLIRLSLDDCRRRLNKMPIGQRLSAVGRHDAKATRAIR